MTSTAGTRRSIDYLPLEEVLEAARNPKGHADAEIRGSIGRFGFVEPIVMDERTGRLVAGHGRLAQLRALRSKAGKTVKAKGGPPDGIVLDGTVWLVPVVRGWRSADDAEAEAYLLTSNRLTELGGWEPASLAETLSSLATIDPDLMRIAGFTDRYLDELLDRLAGEPALPVPGADPHAAPPVADEGGPVLSQLGDLYELGGHRLIVGDASDPAVLARLMDGGRAQVLWTDPPYGVAYTGKNSKRLTILNDKSPDDAIRLFAAVLDAMLLAQVPDDNVRAQLADALAQLQRYPDEHAAIAYGHVAGGGTRARGRGGWHGTNAETSVLQVPRPKSSNLHPTMKPVEVITAHLRNSCRRGGTVLDTFGGSGSTLIAAAQLGLLARLAELDPRYADVICARWQHVTGQPPTIDGQPRAFPPLTADAA